MYVVSIGGTIQSDSHFMKVFYWNIQGFKKAPVVPELKFLIKIHKPNILFLAETLVNEDHLLQIISSLGYNHFDHILPVQHSGGIAVLWNSDHVHVSILAKDERAIHVLIHDISLGISSMPFGIYGPAQKKDKKFFYWDKLLDMCSVVDLPWCIIGDFS